MNLYQPIYFRANSIISFQGFVSHVNKLFFIIDLQNFWVISMYSRRRIYKKYALFDYPRLRTLGIGIFFQGILCFFYCFFTNYETKSFLNFEFLEYAFFEQIEADILRLSLDVDELTYEEKINDDACCTHEILDFVGTAELVVPSDEDDNVPLVRFLHYTFRQNEPPTTREVLTKISTNLLKLGPRETVLIKNLKMYEKKWYSVIS